MRGLLLFALLCFALGAHGVIETYDFETELQRQRYQNFIDELRCPKCQNQNLSGSDAAIAQDLRREIHRMITAGKSDGEITQYMVNRYGDFVLYRPRVTAATAVLWFGPLGLAVVGALIWWRLASSRRRGKAPAAADLSAEEQQRLAALMEDEAPPAGESRRD